MEALIKLLIQDKLDNAPIFSKGKSGLSELFQEAVRELAKTCGPEDPELAPGTASVQRLRAIARMDVLPFIGETTMDPEDLPRELQELLIDGLVMKPIHEGLWVARPQPPGTKGGAKGPSGAKATKQRENQAQGEPRQGAATAGGGARASPAPAAPPQGAKRVAGPVPATAPTAASSTASWAGRVKAAPASSLGREAGGASGAARPARASAPAEQPSSNGASARPPPPPAGAGASGGSQPEPPSTSRAPRRGSSRAREQQPASRFVQVRGVPCPAGEKRRTQHARSVFNAAGFDAAAVESIVEARVRRNGRGQVLVLEFKTKEAALRFMRGKAARLMALEPKFKIFLDFAAPPPTVDPNSAEAQARVAALTSLLEQQGLTDQAKPEERRATRSHSGRRRSSGATPAPASRTEAAAEPAPAPPTPAPAPSTPEAPTPDPEDAAADEGVVAMDVANEADSNEGPDDLDGEPALPLNGTGLATASGSTPDLRANQPPEAEEVEASQASQGSRPRLALPTRACANTGEASEPQVIALTRRVRAIRDGDSDQARQPPCKMQATSSGPGGQTVAHETSEPSPIKTPVPGKRRQAEPLRPPALTLPPTPPRLMAGQTSPILLLSPTAPTEESEFETEAGHESA